MQAILDGASTETVTQVAHEIRRADKRSAAEKAIIDGISDFETVFKHQLYDVWSFPGLDPGFGKKWPGNIPASLIANALYYFTDPGDLVVDPMAGGGVALDVCKALGRECMASDIKPRVEENQEARHRQGTRTRHEGQGRARVLGSAVLDSQVGEVR